MVLSIFIDVLLVAILICGIALGIKRGFIRTLTRPVRFVGSIAIALSLANSVSIGIIEPMINAPLASQVESYLAEHAVSETGEYPTVIKFAAGLSGIDLSVPGAAGDTVTTLIAPVVHFICLIVSFVLLLILSRIALTIIFKILASVFDGAILALPNRIAGCIVSGVLFFVFAWIFVSVFDFFIHLPALASKPWAAEFGGGYIYKFFKAFSPIDLILGF